MSGKENDRDYLIAKLLIGGQEPSAYRYLPNHSMIVITGSGMKLIFGYHKVLAAEQRLMTEKGLSELYLNKPKEQK